MASIKDGTIIQGLELMKELPYRCNLCDTLFPSKVMLLHYFKTLLGETADESNRFGRSLEHIGNFVNHMIGHVVERVHENELNGERVKESKPYPGFLCEQSFVEVENDEIEHASNEKTINYKEEQVAPYECIECGKGFKKKDIFEKHKKRHIGRAYKCTLCPKSYRKHCELMKHMEKHTGEKYDRHRSGDKDFKCDICDKAFAHRPNLIIHSRIHTGEKPFKCDQCDKTFIMRRGLIRHVHFIHGNFEKKTHQCDICNKVFSKASNLKTHKKFHIGELSHVCTQCGKGFVLLGQLKSHMITHAGEKAYKCDECGKAFNRKQELQRHHRNIHNPDSVEKSFQCEICSKTFYELAYLTTHKKTHTGVKPYECNYCNKCFSNKTNLNRHELTHTGEKPHKCIQCNKTFSRKTTCCQGLPTVREEEANKTSIVIVSHETKSSYVHNEDNYHQVYGSNIGHKSYKVL